MVQSYISPWLRAIFENETLILKLQFLLQSFMMKWKQQILFFMCIHIHLSEGPVMKELFFLLCSMTQPMFLGGLIRYFSPGSDMNRDTAYLYAAGVVVCSFFIVLIENPLWLAALHAGMKMRVGTCSLIYRKVNLSATNLEIDFSFPFLYNFIFLSWFYVLSVHYDALDKLLIRYFAFIRLWKKKEDLLGSNR